MTQYGRGIFMKKQRVMGILSLILGIFLLFAGIYALSHLRTTFAGMTVFYGVLAVFTGIVDIVSCAKMDYSTGFVPVIGLASGAFSIAAGVMLLFHPAAGGISLMILFPIWFIAHCVSELARLPYIRYERGEGYYIFALAVNIIGLILGAMLLFSPFLSLFSLPVITGVYLVLLGIDSIVLGVQNIVQ